MMFAAPELFEAERIDLLDEFEVAAELQHRMLADRGMRGEEGSEFEARHGFLSGLLLLLIACCAGYVLESCKAIAEPAWRPIELGAKRAAAESPRRSGCTPRPHPPHD